MAIEKNEVNLPIGTLNKNQKLLLGAAIDMKVKSLERAINNDVNELINNIRKDEIKELNTIKLIVL